jgi:hypothetical protein
VRLANISARIFAWRQHRLFYAPRRLGGKKRGAIGDLRVEPGDYPLKNKTAMIMAVSLSCCLIMIWMYLRLEKSYCASGPKILFFCNFSERSLLLKFCKKNKHRDIASSPFFSAAAMSEQRAGIQSAIYNHMTKQCHKLFLTPAALKNGLDAISRKDAPEQNKNL